jgi:hypothetical protein
VIESSRSFAITHTRRVNRRELVLALTVLAVKAAHASRSDRVLVLFPDRPDPERALFRSLIDNFSTALGTHGLTPVEHALSTSTPVDEIASLIADQRPLAIVALGSVAIGLAQQARSNIPILVGAVEVPVPTSGLAGISLIVDPHRVFSTLTDIAPTIKAVSLVLQVERYGWLRPHIEQAARDQSLQLSVFPAQTIGEAAAQYLTVLRGSNPKLDSLWLLNQPEFLTPDTLPRLIEEAWARGIVVFSSVLEHVNEGALFAHYLSPAGTGRRLSQLLLNATQHPGPIILDDVPARAVNLRTARHLAGVVDLRKTAEFDLVLGTS